MTMAGDGQNISDLTSGKLHEVSGYINVVLPDFNKDKSYFIISVALQSKDHTGQNVNLLITPGLVLAKVIQTKSQPTDISEWFIVDNKR